MDAERQDRDSEVAPAGDSSAELSATAIKRPRGPILVWGLAGALIAGAGAWIGGESTYQYYFPTLDNPPNWNQMGPYEKMDYRSQEMHRKTPLAETKNAELAYGLLGAALCALLGVAGGLAGRSVRAGLVGALVGLVMGAAAGAGMAAVMGPIFYRLINPESGLFVPAVTHGAMWTLIGVAGGLAFALGLGDPRRIGAALVGGLLGAVMGTIAFEALNATAFPLVRVLEPVPADRMARLAAHMCVALFVTLGVVLAVKERAKSASPVGKG